MAYNGWTRIQGFKDRDCEWIFRICGQPLCFISSQKISHGGGYVFGLCCADAAGDTAGREVLGEAETLEKARTSVALKMHDIIYTRIKVQK